MLGELAAAAAKTATFLGERYWRIVKRRSKLKTLLIGVRVPVQGWVRPGGRLLHHPR
ncbi:hypothetical protein [Streptosporangium sp. CA-115845]|uniref:hypothetical protein n=1 Tax=Streptosporangium sp. CA-115845 TaxID=3240071 RepID=UPI003D93C007